MAFSLKFFTKISIINEFKKDQVIRLGGVAMKPIWQGEKLLIRRKHLGLTMAELAAKVDCDRPLVSMWEAGKVAPSGHFLVMLGIVLNIEPKEFYSLDEGGSNG